MFKAIALLMLTISVANASQWQGAIAPELAIPNQLDKTVKIDDLRGDWVILYFYPKDETPGCTLEANNFRDDFSKYQELGAKIVGVSLDSTKSHREFIKNHNLPFDLLSDVEGVASKRYKVLLNLGVMKMAKRQTFIVDPDGIIVKHYNDVEPEEHSQQILGDLPALIKLWEATKV